MKDTSSWASLKRGVARDFQRGLRKLSPAGAETLQRTLTYLQVDPWLAFALLPLDRRYLPLLVGVGVLAIWKLPQWYAASWAPLIDATVMARLESDTRTAMIQAAGGLGLLAGLYFTAKTWRTTQEGQITDRFTKAIAQLGEAGPDKLAIRLGGIYALERIARDSERDHWPIMEVLTAYVREHAPWPPKAVLPRANQKPTEKQFRAAHEQPRPKPATDIQAILTVLGRRAQWFGQGETQRLDLRHTDLRGIHLLGAHLEQADLEKARLEGAALVSAHLEGAYLGAAHLEGASLSEAHLEEADLVSARLEGAYLGAAHLEKAILWETHLERANLAKACLEGAYLGAAHLEEACLEEACLEGADLGHAHLVGARNLTVEQLCTVKTLYQAQLDPPLAAQVRQRCPHLLRPPAHGKAP